MRINERALLAIVAAIEEYPNDRPYNNSCPDHEKEVITFSRWALEEILNLVWDHPWTLASDVVENFALQCQIYELSSELPDQKRIFSIAAKTALELLEDIKEAEM